MPIAKSMFETLSANVAPEVLSDQTNGFIENYRRSLQAGATGLAT